MAPIVCIFVFVYGLIERDFWWALLSATAAFFFCFAVEFFYACWMFTALMNAISGLAAIF